jgi:hypothetical protein
MTARRSIIPGARTHDHLVGGFPPKKKQTRPNLSICLALWYNLHIESILARRRPKTQPLIKDDLRAQQHQLKREREREKNVVRLLKRGLCVILRERELWVSSDAAADKSDGCACDDFERRTLMAVRESKLGPRTKSILGAYMQPQVGVHNAVSLDNGPPLSAGSSFVCAR